MLSTWDPRDDDRPTFSSLVATLSSYLESTSDYLDLGGFDKPSKSDKQEQQEDDSELSLACIPSCPNDYIIASPQES